MYLDYSPTKWALLILTAILLFGTAFFTYYAKWHLFGSTPYVYVATQSIEYAFQSVGAALHGNVRANASEGFAQGIPILTYHRVLREDDPNNVTRNSFREHMRALKEAGWETVTLTEFENYIDGTIELPKKSFLLTFDDGAKDSFYPVDPVLRELGYEASIFIIVASSETPGSTYYLTREEIAWMLRTGRWEIGSHSFDGHRPYPTDSEGGTGIFFADRLWREAEGRLETPEEFRVRVSDDLRRARRALEERYQRPIPTFAFPLGNETGIEGANNFPEGSQITEQLAREQYRLGFVQGENRHFTAMFPSTTTTSFRAPFPATIEALGTRFLAERIHVEHDWSGERLVRRMENSLAKPLPFEDDFSSEKGWIPAWGSFEMGRNNLQMRSVGEQTSASTFLDGSALWGNYTFDTQMTWTSGFILLLADVRDSRTYHSCAFGRGVVRIQETVGGETRTLAETRSRDIAYGTDVRPGLRVRDDIIECTWNYNSLVYAADRAVSGGIGMQVWDPDGSAELQVATVLVRPIP